MSAEMDSTDTLDWDIPELKEIPYYDEDAIYHTKPEEMSADDAITDLILKKSAQIDLSSATRSTTRKGGEREQLVLGKETTDYWIRVERLLWVDGWRETTGEESNRQHHGEMTLVVLKLSFFTKTQDSKVGFARAELRFKAKDKHDKDPEVVAWGPFRNPETWNASKAQRKVNIKNEQRLEAGYAGQKGVLGRTAEDETSWERVDFDSGRSTQLSNLEKTGAGPNGVAWTVSQNTIHRQGVTPEIRVGVLISRSPAAQYYVDFRLTAITGTFSVLKERLKGLAGVSGESNTWTVTVRPGDISNCYAEGTDIVQSIDINNLGGIVSKADKTNLDPAWLNAWPRFEVPQPKATGEDGVVTADSGDHEVAVAAATAAAAAVAATASMTASKPFTAAQRPILIAPEPSQHRQEEPKTGQPALGSGIDIAKRTLLGGPHPTDVAADAPSGGVSATPPTGAKVPDMPSSPSVIPAYRQSEPYLVRGLPSFDQSYHEVYGRLVSLESRAAQAEARIAAQDQLIFKLQRALASMASNHSP